MTLSIDKGRNEEFFRKPVKLKLDGVRTQDVLDALSLHYYFGYRIEGHQLLVSHNPFFKSQPVMRIYDVTDITSYDYGWFFCGCFPDPSLFNDPVPAPKRPPAAPSNDFGPTSPTVTNVADMVRNRVRPDQWDAALGTSIEERGGRLVVMQHEQIHREISALLATFRAGQNRQVAIDVRCLSVRSVDVDRIRAEADARGVSRPVLDETALNALQELVKGGQATPVFTGNTLGHNGQDCWIQNFKQIRNVTDYEVVDNTYEPVVRTRFQGAGILCEPILSNDTTWVKLRLRAAHSTLLGSDDFLISRGGSIEVAPPPAPPPPQPPAPPAAEKKMEPAPAPATEIVAPPPPPVANTPVEPPQAKTKRVPGPLYVQLLTLGFNKISQDMSLRTGQTVAISAPMYGAKGIEPGREMLLTIRADIHSPDRTERDVAPTPPPSKTTPPSEALAKLLAKPMTLKLENATVLAALQAVAKTAALPVVLTDKCLEDKPDISISIDVKDRPAAEVLQTVLDQAKLDLLPHLSLLSLCDQDMAIGRRTYLHIYDITDMTRTMFDFPTSMYILPQDRPEEVSNPFDTTAAANGFQAADLATLIKERLYPADFSNPATAIEESGGKLVVMAEHKTHLKITAKLNEFRELALRSIAMTTRWAIVDTAALEAAFGRNPPAVLDPAQTEKVLGLIAANGARDLAAARFNCRPAYRSSAAGGIHRDTITGYSHFGNPPDPTPGRYQTGAAADYCVYPIDEIDGTRHLRADVRIALSAPDLKPRIWDPFNSTDKNAAPKVPGDAPIFGHFQQTANEYARVLTSVTFPEGGAALFRMTPPTWIEGENPEALRKGERTLLILVQGQSQRFNK